MALFEQFPYTNFHELNLDWIVKSMTDLIEEWDNFGTNVTASAQSGATPDVTVTGDFQTSVNFDFTIPPGATGPQGPEGPQGPPGQDGQDGNTNVYTGIGHVSGTTLTIDTDTADYVGDDYTMIFVRLADALPSIAGNYTVVIDGGDSHSLSLSETTLTSISTSFSAGQVIMIGWNGGSYYTLVSSETATLPASGVTAGTYGNIVTSATGEYHVPTITVDTYGIITSASNTITTYYPKGNYGTISSGNTTANITANITAVHAYYVGVIVSVYTLSGTDKIVVNPADYDITFYSSTVRVVLKSAASQTTYVSVYGVYGTGGH